MEDWKVTREHAGETAFYLAPEQMRPVLTGLVYGHPEHADGSRVTTSSIVQAEGKRVTVRSGQVYELGEISRSYLAWIQEKGLPYDPDNPVKVRP